MDNDQISIMSKIYRYDHTFETLEDKSLLLSPILTQSFDTKKSVQY